MEQSIQEWTKQRLWKTAINLKEHGLLKHTISLRLYPFKFFKGWLPQILLGPFLNTLSHMKLRK